MPQTAPATTADLRVVRRTFLHANEKRTNFTAIDNDILQAVSSDEAAVVTDKMSKIYLRLIGLHRESPYYQSSGVLCFPGEERAGNWVTGFDQLVAHLGVAPATARKALEWMKGKGIIGYVCPKGFPTRIWLNHAVSSIAARDNAPERKLQLIQGGLAKTESTFFHPETTVVPTFKELMNHEENHEFTNPRTREITPSDSPCDKAPIATSEHFPTLPVDNTGSAVNATLHHFPSNVLMDRGISGEISIATSRDVKKIEEQISALQTRFSNILPACAAAVRAEIDDQLEFQFRKLRQYWQEKAVPQAARVAQQEAYKILNQAGKNKPQQAKSSELYVGSYQPPVASPDTATQAAELTREVALEMAAFIWAENSKKAEPIEDTLKRFYWLWDVEVRFTPTEQDLLQEAVESQRRQRDVTDGLGDSDTTAKDVSEQPASSFESGVSEPCVNLSEITDLGMSETDERQVAEAIRLALSLH